MVGEVSRIANEFFSGLPGGSPLGEVPPASLATPGVGALAPVAIAPPVSGPTPVPGPLPPPRVGPSAANVGGGGLSGAATQPPVPGVFHSPPLAASPFPKEADVRPAPTLVGRAVRHAHAARADVERGLAHAQRDALFSRARGSSQCSRRSSASARSVGVDAASGCVGSVELAAVGLSSLRSLGLGSVSAFGFGSFGSLELDSGAAFGLSSVSAVGFGPLRAAATRLRRGAVGVAVCAQRAASGARVSGRDGPASARLRSSRERAERCCAQSAGARIATGRGSRARDS